VICTASVPGAGSPQYRREATRKLDSELAAEGEGEELSLAFENEAAASSTAAEAAAAAAAARKGERRHCMEIRL
jgi:hypothetical protein